MSKQQKAQELLLQAYNYHQSGKLPEAKELYLKSLKLDKNNPDANHLLGLILKNEGDFDAGIASIQKAIKIAPQNHVYYYNLARIYHQTDRFEKSIETFKKALEVKSDYVDAYFNMGIVYEDYNYLGDAIECYKKAVAIDPNLNDAKFNMSLALLASGKFADGWSAYRSRMLPMKENKGLQLPELNKPLYDDRSISLEGKRLFVYHEQGFGDNIQFIRFLPLLKDKLGLKEVYYKALKPQLSLFQSQGAFLKAHIVSDDPDESLYDYHIPLMDLAWILGITDLNMPFKERYLLPDVTKVKKFDENFESFDRVLKVGLVWQGSKTQKNDHIRSCSSDLFVPLLEIDGCQFFLLQKENFAEGLSKVPLELQDKIINLGAKFDDFADTAAAISRLDMVITVDTSVAHLAAAMGKPVWVVLNYAHVWRYGANDLSNRVESYKYEDSSYWYNTLKLYRQDENRDFSKVMCHVFDDLKSRVNDSFHIRYSEILYPKQPTDEDKRQSYLLTLEAFKLHQAGALDEAKKLYESALELDHTNPDANHLLGVILKVDREYKKAAYLMNKAIRHTPLNITYNQNLGNTYIADNNPKMALVAYKRALMIQPNNLELIFTCGKTAQQASEKDEAKTFYEAVLNIDPNHVFSITNLAIIEKQSKNYEKAVELYKRAIELQPDLLECYSNLAIAYKEMGETALEMECHEKIVELDPKNESASFGLGSYYEGKGEYEKAIPHILRAHDLNPDKTFYLAYLLRLKLKLCEWSDLDRIKKRVIDGACSLDQSINVNPQYTAMFLGELGEPELYAISGAFAGSCIDTINRQENRLKFNFDKWERRAKIRIGYVSADYFDHATMHLLIGILEKHNKDEFEIYAYSLKHNDNNNYFTRLISCVDKFIDLGDMTLAQKAQKIYDDKVDILVDLKGYTQDAQPGIFFLKPAPVQVSWLGMPASFGTDMMDYIVADRVVIPPEHRQYYREKMFYMPHCYQPNDDTQVIEDKPLTKADCSLPEDAFVFCDFNNPYKATPWVFDIWMDILKEAPNSVFWQIFNNPVIENNLRQEAQKRGIDQSRLIFAPHVVKRAHLNRLQLADLFLDTIDCTAHTTASDALYAGLPLLTLKGNTFAKRVAASLLTCVGLEDDLVVESVEEYKKRALYLYNNPDAIKALKAKVKHNVSTHPLFQTERYTKNLERGFKQVYENAIIKKQIVDVEIIEP